MRRFRKLRRKECTLNRITLSPRDNDVERLISGLPFEFNGDRNGLRRWTANMKASANAFQIDKAKANVLARAGKAVRHA